MDLNQNFTDLADDELTSYMAEVRAAFDALAALESPTADQIAEAEALADHLDGLLAENSQRAEAAEALDARAAALKNRFPEAEAEEETEEEETEEEDAAEDAVVEGEVVDSKTEALPVAARSNVATLAKKTVRPKAPAPSYKPVYITAAADVPEFSTGSRIETMTAVGKAWTNRLRGFSAPTGDGSTENLQHYGVASFRLDFPADLTVDRGTDEMDVLLRARDEKRLPGGSLVAAGGWCAPSETIYDLCPGGTLDGLLSLPEINISRGGIKYTQGPDFSALYSAGFCQTEAQAIAGTTKPCYEIPCPTFVEVRLEACGICIKVPILTQVGYPELIAAYLSEAMVAHQHAMNAKILAQLATALGPPVAFPGLGSVSGDTFEALLLAGANLRQAQRLDLSQSLEVVVPFWGKDVIKSDLYRRTGCCGAPPTDADVAAIFSAANMNVQYVYDWEPLPAASVAWPDTIPALIYPAGSFVKGVADVINLNAVYDAASLAVNTYTGLFFEQGILLAQMCKDGVAVELPVCTAGRTGAADLTCATP